MIDCTTVDWRDQVHEALEDVMKNTMRSADTLVLPFGWVGAWIRIREEIPLLRVSFGPVSSPVAAISADRLEGVW